MLAAQAEEVRRCFKVEIVLKVDIPSNAVAAAVDIILDRPVVSNLGGHLKLALSDNGRFFYNGSFSVESPPSEGEVKDLEFEAELDRQCEFEFDTNLSSSFDAVLKRGRHIVSVAVVDGVEKVQVDVGIVPFNPTADEQGTRGFDLERRDKRNIEEWSDADDEGNLPAGKIHMGYLVRPLLLVLDVGDHSKIKACFEIHSETSSQPDDIEPIRLESSVEGSLPFETAVDAVKCQAVGEAALVLGLFDLGSCVETERRLVGGARAPMVATI